MTITSNVPVARMVALKHALSLELKGLGRRGRSVYSIIKQEFGLTGNRQQVYMQFCELTEQAKRGNYVPPARTPARSPSNSPQ